MACQSFTSAFAIKATNDDSHFLLRSRRANLFFRTFAPRAHNQGWLRTTIGFEGMRPGVWRLLRQQIVTTYGEHNGRAGTFPDYEKNCLCIADFRGVITSVWRHRWYPYNRSLRFQ